VTRIPNLLEARYKDNAPKLCDLAKRVRAYRWHLLPPPRRAGHLRQLAHMWQDQRIEPLPEAGPTIFLQHMDYLIPDQRERELALNWLAWCVQKPTEKQMFALLMVDDGGTGRAGWLHAPRAVRRPECRDDRKRRPGHRYVQRLDRSNRQLGFIHELVPDRRVDLASRLKGVITEAHIWSMRNSSHALGGEPTNLLCCSNHRDALKIAAKIDDGSLSRCIGPVWR